MEGLASKVVLLFDERSAQVKERGVPAALITVRSGRARVRAMRHALPSLFALSLAACSVALGSGCAPLPPRAPAPLPVEPPALAPAPPATACPLPIREADGTTRRVNMTLPPSESAWLRLEVEGRYEDDRVPVHYERRSDSGREAGTVVYVCDARGLSLESMGPETDRWSFAPPLLVAASAPGQGSTEGRATRRHEGTTTTYSYAQAWEALPAEPTPRFAGREGWWRDMAHAVVVRDSASQAAYEWATSARWAVVDGVPFAATRALEISDGRGTVTRQEEARNLLPP